MVCLLAVCGLLLSFGSEHLDHTPRWHYWWVGLQRFLMGLIQFKMDGPLDASPIHGAAGIWGLLAVGLFADNDGAAHQDLFYAGNLDQFLYQIVGILIMCTWCMGFTGGSFTTPSTSTRRPFSGCPWISSSLEILCSTEDLHTRSSRPSLCHSRETFDA